MRFLDGGESQARNAVIEVDRVHAEARLVVQHAGERPLADLLDAKAGHCVQAHAADAVRVHLVHVEDERISVDQVPRVARQLSGHVANDSRWTEQRHPGVTGKEQPNQPIEADEVVDVRVRNEDVRELEDLGGGEAVEPAEVELQRRTLPAQADVQAGVTERPVDQAREERGFHGGILREAAAGGKGDGRDRAEREASDRQWHRRFEYAVTITASLAESLRLG